MSNSAAVFITGTSSGIGRACALGLDREGYRVFAGVRRAEDGEGLKREASERLVPVIADIVDPEQVDTAAKSVTRHLGDLPLAALINNAGISVNGPLEIIPIDELRRQLEVNIVAQVRVTQKFLPLLRKSKGRIINIGSTAGFLAVPMLGPYSASKYGMEAVADVLRRELAPWNIKVALIQPGSIATPIWAKGKKEGRQFVASASKEDLDLYGSIIDRTMKLVEKSEKEADPPDVVLRAVLHALIAKRPRTRYLVGKNSRMEKFISMLPDGVQDRILSRFFRTPKEGTQ